METFLYREQQSGHLRLPDCEYNRFDGLRMKFVFGDPSLTRRLAIDCLDARRRFADSRHVIEKSTLQRFAKRLM
jgi:hypothetical protein